MNIYLLLHNIQNHIGFHIDIIAAQKSFHHDKSIMDQLTNAAIFVIVLSDHILLTLMSSH